MNKGISLSHSQSSVKSTLQVVLAASILTLSPISAAFTEEETEPKQLQKLYKCLDKKIDKLSKKKRKSSASKVFKKCDKRLQKWLAQLPEESHEAFKSQLTESVTLALEEASNGKFALTESSF